MKSAADNPRAGNPPQPEPPPALGPVTPPRHAGQNRLAVVLFFLCAALFIVSDLTSKALAFRYTAEVPVHLDRHHPDAALQIPDHQPVTLIPHVLSVRLTLNQGAVFGLGQGGKWFFVAISLVAAVVIVFIFWRSSPRAYHYHLALAMMLAGALGNLYDRIAYNAVRDLLWLFPGVNLPWGLRWPGGSPQVYPWIFNIADVALVLGVIIILITVWVWPPGEAPATGDTVPGINPGKPRSGDEKGRR